MLFYSEAGIWWLVLVVIFTQTEYALRERIVSVTMGKTCFLSFWTLLFSFLMWRKPRGASRVFSIILNVPKAT